MGYDEFAPEAPLDIESVAGFFIITIFFIQAFT